ncbi:hypothetical protein Neosp_001766 [[Neocosmospora] mangrovei]
MSMTIYNPGATGSVVKELLADWTVLTEKEIESTTTEGQCPEQKDGKSSEGQCPEKKDGESSEGSQNKDGFVFLKDALGRKFKLPFYKVEKFEGIHRLLNAAFAGVDVLGPHVCDGHFYLEDSDGYQLVPELWDDLIRPGMNITMTMWQMDKVPSPKSSILPGRPAQPINLEDPSQLGQSLGKHPAFAGFQFGKPHRPAKRVPKDKNKPAQVATGSRPWDEVGWEQWNGDWGEDQISKEQGNML